MIIIGHTQIPVLEEDTSVGRDVFRKIVGVCAVLIVLLSSSMVLVRERHTALVTRFGELKTVVEEPGLHWKLPWPIDEAHVIDQRSRVFNTRHSEMLTRDRRNVILLSYTLWKVADPLRFYQAVGTIEDADEKLNGLVTDAKTGVLGNYDMSAFVSTNPDELKTSQIEADVLASAKVTALEKYGIELEEFGFKRVSLPEENIPAVFAQMRAERQQHAARFRAEGERDAKVIREDTDVEVAKILAEASEQEKRIRGEAESEAARIYAESHAIDPDLYRFLRYLDSLEVTLGEGAEIILRTDREPFHLLKGQGFSPAPTDDGKGQGDGQ